jgi:DNA-directed RNA polymerase specialized sigma24 family protein
MTTKSDHNQNETFLKLLAQSEVILRAYLRSLVNDQNHLSEVLQNTFIVGWKNMISFRDPRTTLQNGSALSVNMKR